jgi:ABC-type sugar transport system ATPase subunit
MARSSWNFVDVSYRGVRDISFELKRGEILGLAGLVGSGRTETALTIFGITPATSGQITLDGKPVAHHQPRSRRAISASPMCRRTVASRVWSGTEHCGEQSRWPRSKRR